MGISPTSAAGGVLCDKAVGVGGHASAAIVEKLEVIGQHGPKSGGIAAFEEDSEKCGVGRHDGGFQRRGLGEGGERKGGDEGGGHGDRELFN